MSQSTAPDSSNGEAAAAAARDAVRPATLPKHVVVIVLVVLSAVLSVGLLLQLFVARRIPELTANALDEALARWEANGPRNYDMQISIEGNRPGTVEVEIRDGQVTAMTRDGQTPSQARTWQVWGVPGQFEMLERELEMAADPSGEMQVDPGTKLWLRCEFDPDYGYPRRFHRAVFGGGAEVFWEVTKFVERK